MKAFLKHAVEGEPVESVKLLYHTLEVLDWAREKWANVARLERGAVLELSWRRGVFCMLLRHFVQVSRFFTPRMRMVCYGRKLTSPRDGIQAIEATGGEEPGFTLDKLKQEANSLLEDMKSVQPLNLAGIQEQGPGFHSAFFILPRGCALQ